MRALMMITALLLVPSIAGAGDLCDVKLSFISPMSDSVAVIEPSRWHSADRRTKRAFMEWTHKCLGKRILLTDPLDPTSIVAQVHEGLIVIP